MDEIVKRGMARWPNVPSVYGWLGLDRRGRWLIKGERISNPIVADFIGRNYERDSAGRWYFQNGPQRVFVSLAYTPFVYRMAWDAAPDALYRMETHTGHAVTRIDGAWMDEAGIVLIASEYGIGLVDDRDLDRLLPCFTDAGGTTLAEDAVDAAIGNLHADGSAGLHFRYRQCIVPVTAIGAAEVPVKFGFVQRPVQPAGEEECY